MKIKFTLLFLSLISFALNAQDDSTGLGGDNFSLEGALNLFKQAKSPEEFEQLINTESSKINNLDLNQDNEIDYIKVIGNTEKDAHIFILRVPISASENQDIAVIEIEKTENEEAHIQIIGDEEIFGEEKVVEPSDGSKEDDSEEEESGGPSPNKFTSIIVVNVWQWPCVRHIYSPGYVVWNSAWRWHLYPKWWISRRPLTWNAWHPFRYQHRGANVRFVHSRRLVTAHRIYTPVRVHSRTVKTHYAGARKNYTVTRSKTKVTGPKGKTHTKTTTTVKGPNGHVKAKRTKVKRGK